MLVPQREVLLAGAPQVRHQHAHQVCARPRRAGAQGRGDAHGALPARSASVTKACEHSQAHWSGRASQRCEPALASPSSSLDRCAQVPIRAYVHVPAMCTVQPTAVSRQRIEAVSPTHACTLSHVSQQGWFARSRLRRLDRQCAERRPCCEQIFKRFHAAYVDAVCNPFYSVNTVRHTSAIANTCFLDVPICAFQCKCVPCWWCVVRRLFSTHLGRLGVAAVRQVLTRASSRCVPTRH